MEMGRLKERLWPLILILASILLVSITSFATSISGIIDENNCIWGPAGSKAHISGDIIFITGDVIVPEGITLRILPGTVVKVINKENPNLSKDNLFYGTELAIYGTLAAEGTKDNPIIFAGAETYLGSWQGIFSLGNLKLDNVYLKDAVSAIYSSGIAVYVSSCSLLNNITAISLQGWQSATIEESVIENNIDGIACASTDAKIKGNIIANNDVGIRILLGESGPYITENHFTDNRSYHIYNLCNRDIIAYPNQWDLPSEKIFEKIFDGRVEPEAGSVIYSTD